MEIEKEYYNFLRMNNVRFSTENGLPPLDFCINPNIDWDEVNREFKENKFVIIDDFYTQPTIDRLRNYCLFSNYYDRYYTGYRALEFYTYQDSPTIIKNIIEETSNLLDIFGEYNRGWFFMHDYESRGVKSHIDLGAYVTLSTWLTPEDCFYDPENYNGLILHLDGGSKTIGYKYNRALLFDSHIHHESQGTSVIPNWKNQKINLTLLYGKRLEW